MARQQSLTDDSVAGRIAAELADRIIYGRLAPGLPLRQDHVAVEFGASHVPVREAFRRLEAQGLLVSEPRRGVRVAPLDPGSIAEISEMRAALEGVALRHAVPRMTVETHAELKNLLDREANVAAGDLAELARLNVAFHRALCVPCQMPRLLESIDTLHKASLRMLVAMWAKLPAWRDNSHAEHKVIAEAAIRGDVEAVASLSSNHILGGSTKLSALASSASDAKAPPSTDAAKRA